MFLNTHPSNPSEPVLTQSVQESVNHWALPKWECILALCAQSVNMVFMDKLRRAVNEIAYSQDHSKLPTLHRSLVPLLSLASSLYKVALLIRHHLYQFGVFSKHRLPVPVISVGNLTWGGNGKTPMVEFISLWLADSGLSPLILTRGYGGGDEARMLERHLLGRPAKIGVGPDRAAVAASFFEKYGCLDPLNSILFERIGPKQKLGDHPSSENIGAVILDDGMQHWRLKRELEIVMVNGLMPWGNHQLLPLGPLREPLTSLRRADVAVVHHSDLVSEQKVKDAVLSMREINESLPIFFSRMSPSHFFEIGNINANIPLSVVHNVAVLCVSAIGSANSFVRGMEKVGSFFVDQLDFSDHHSLQAEDVEKISMRVRDLELKFGIETIVVVTEKDYDRDPVILKQLEPVKVFVLCSKLQIVPKNGYTEDSFKNLLKELLKARLSHTG
ncbi:probable tetraacyldisaccharide 4'-kinase, mitochondrial isoform X1 [Tripterygium wilfordii]|nr:probable tetraacyldisaccharide 4'-kinase, mitochondrial isoform X1 [Tripterygium wilfordii]